jgi:S-(hydroxymethyl)glutathione dehydrogenase / alcohol dehydrogenase
VKAAVLREYGSPISIEEVQLDPPGPGEVQVRLAASGVCRSDLHNARGVHEVPLPIVLGHEGAGVVEAVGEDVGTVRPGDHVVLTWLPYCGRCRRCISGRPVLCREVGWSDRGLMRDGTTRLRDVTGTSIHHDTSSTFAEATIVPIETVIPVDQALPLVEVALLGCAVMTGVGAVVNTAGVRAGESVVVIGCGGVGLSAIQGAVVVGASPIVAIDVVAEKLELAKQLGATHAATDEDGLREVLPDGADHVFECLGARSTIELALGVTGAGGQTVLVGLAPPDARVLLDPLTMVVEERRVLGSYYGSCVPPRDIPMLLELMRAGKLRLGPLVSSTIHLEEINEAFERMERGQGARSVIVFD